MNIGIIGFGSIGERHMLNIQELYPQMKIDILTKRKDIKDSKNICILSSASEFYKKQHDIYFITNETHKHADTILRCLQNRPRGIFIEKPLSNTLKGMEIIKKEVRRQKTNFFVAYCLQFFTPLIFLKKLIQKEEIGDVFFIRVSAGKDLRTWRSGDYKKHYSSDRQKGGGVILDLIHEINYPAWLLNEKIRLAKGLTTKISHLQLKCEDITEGIFLSKSGKIISIHQDYLQVPGRRYCEILGTKGTLIWDKMLIRNSVENEIKIHTAKKSKVIKIKAGGNDMYQKELQFFIQKVRKNKGYSNLDEAMQDMKNALALQRLYKK